MIGNTSALKYFAAPGGAADHDLLRFGAHQRRHADSAPAAEAALAFKKASTGYWP